MHTTSAESVRFPSLATPHFSCVALFCRSCVRAPVVSQSFHVAATLFYLAQLRNARLFPSSCCFRLQHDISLSMELPGRESFVLFFLFCRQQRQNKGPPWRRAQHGSLGCQQGCVTKVSYGEREIPWQMQLVLFRDLRRTANVSECRGERRARKNAEGPSSLSICLQANTCIFHSGACANVVLVAVQ